MVKKRVKVQDYIQHAYTTDTYKVKSYTRHTRKRKGGK